MSMLYTFYGTLLIIFFIIVLIAYVFESKKIQNKHYKEKELMNAHFEQALLQSQLEIQEQTFKTISQEIHDNIGQMLTLVKVNLDTIDLNVNEKATEKLKDAKEVLKKANQSLRDIAKTLNSDTITQVGIVRAIELELELLQKITALKTTCSCNTSPVGINPQVELILFRIIQEALHNIIKHANASSIQVHVESVDNTLKLQVTDDGVGFDRFANNNSGSGLNNIESRCKLINATFDLQSSPGEGTTVSITLPLHPASIQGSL